jgi:hypothetical protein
MVFRDDRIETANAICPSHYSDCAARRVPVKRCEPVKKYEGAALCQMITSVVDEMDYGSL